MAASSVQACSQRAAIDLLARDALGGEEKRRAHEHLTACDACRTGFRKLTAGRFPKIRNYTILEHVGKGGFGNVYTAIHHTKGRIEALKVSFGDTPFREAYFENEVHLVARLSHPNIATLYEAQLHSSPPYYAMEFVEGENLDEFVESHRVTLREQIEIFRRIVQAVGYAHAQGVVHRDLKSQNILIDSDGQPRIIDFGISKRLSAASPAQDSDPTPATEGPLGTFGYIAPEQLAGGPIDGRADIFSLGALLFHWITGEPPKFARQRTRLRAILYTRQFARPNDLASIIERCTADLPEQRYACCDDLVADLDRYLSGAAVAASQDHSPVYRLRRIGAYLVQNYPVRVQVGLTLGVVALCAVLFVYAPVRSSVAGGMPGANVRLVAFDTDTIEFIRNEPLRNASALADADNPRSWRVVHARLLDQLAQARPRAIAFDYYFPACQPAFDPEFVSSLEKSPVPVVVGAAAFDLNSEPAVCPDILAAVDGVGALVATRPNTRPGEFVIPIAIVRGHEAPIPSLALRTFAAARQPACDLRLDPQKDSVRILYRRRDAEAGESRWLPDADSVPFVDEIAAPSGPYLDAGDRPLYARLPIPPIEPWSENVISASRVLAASPQELRKWFADRVVLIGQTLPGRDEWTLEGKRRIFGCEVQAMAIDALLARSVARRYSVFQVILRVAVGAAIGLLAGLAAARRRALRDSASHAADSPRARAPHREAAVLLLFAALSVVAAAFILSRVADPWIVEVAMLLAPALAAGAIGYLATVAREHNFALSPRRTRSVADSTLSSTWLVETRSTSNVASEVS